MNEIYRAIEHFEHLQKRYTTQHNGKHCELVKTAIAALREKADFVRCKYCEYWQDNNGGYPHEECRWGHDETPDADDFCSCGKRLGVERDG